MSQPTPIPCLVETLRYIADEIVPKQHSEIAAHLHESADLLDAITKPGIVLSPGSPMPVAYRYRSPTTAGAWRYTEDVKLVNGTRYETQALGVLVPSLTNVLNH